ncbi:5-epiaristolochene synthase-like [Chenopodium quinoa]|uniref:5-epiaristolochene synthase-like n=1 Tax=Chenopodium quinoa TaxID=63459 RepID=UPI000B77B6BB|nr:5-epiaristolochene synthase-like [Chenopodium quinoa]
MATATIMPLQASVVVRPHAHFPPDIWGDRFDNFTNDDILKMERYAKETEPLKKEVLLMLMDDSNHLGKTMRLIDAVERLGFPYLFENEIKKLLDNCFNEFALDNFKMDYDLCNTSLQFRVLRQHGYKMPCDVFTKFTNEEGKFKETLRSDTRGMLSLYEAAHLRIHDEDILDEALIFTTDSLNAVASTSEQARCALKQPLQQGIQRVQARHFISFYEEDEFRNDKLLQLAKIEFNRLQLLHCQELSHIQKWWKSYDFVKRLPYVRQRSVESHYWAVATYYEPCYSFTREMYTKYFMVLLVLDDTYDAYGTFEELHQLTDSFHRWDLSLVEQLPEDYMKIVYEFVINTCDELANEMTKRGKPYAAHFGKEQVLKLIRNYYIEAKWVNTRYVPTFEEYMVNGRVTAGVQVCVTGSLLGMDEVAEEKPYVQLMEAPKAVEACEYIVRLMDDVVTGEAELTRGCRLATSVECYMKDYNKSKEEVLQIFKKKMENAWKDLAQEGLLTNQSPSDFDHFSKPVYDRILNYGRIMDVMYKVADGYTLPEATIKKDVIITYSQPFSI